MTQYLRRVIIVSLPCLFFTAVSNANLGIISQLAQQNDNHWIGPLSIGLIFFGSGTGAIYSKYISKYPYNRIIFTGSFGWNIYCTFSVIFLFIGFEIYVQVIIIIGSILCGLTVSLYYNGIFNYYNQCGQRDKKSKQYFGIACCINQSANIIGGGFSAILIQPLKQQNYSILMLALCFTSSICFLFFKDFEGRIKRESSFSLDKNFSQEQSIISETNQGQTETKNSGKAPLSMLFCFGLSGVILSFVFTQFSLLFYQYFPNTQKEELNHLTFIAFMIQGCGQFTGGLLFAIFSKKIVNLSLAYTLNGLIFLGTVLLFYFAFEQNIIVLIYIGAFLVGFQDCFCYSMALSMGGFWQESGISLFNLGQSGFVALLSVPTIFLSLPYLSLTYLGIFILSTVVLLINRKTLKKIHQEYSE